MPRARHSLQLALAPTLEDETRARDQILDRARYEHLAGSGPSRYARTDVDCDSAHRGPVELDLTGMDADAYVESERTGILGDGQTATDSARGAVENSEEAIARDVDLAPAEPREK